MIRVITIEREYGCGGGEIAAKLSGLLGWQLWDDLLTSEIARLARCEKSQVEKREERVDPLYYRLLKSVLRGSFEGSVDAHRLNMLDADTVFRLSQKLVQQAAEKGNAVIVGRGSQHFLRDRKDALRIFLYANTEEKVRRLVAGGMTQAEAEALVPTVDHERASFIEKYFHMEWPDRSLYHSMINTAVGNETVISSILCLKSAL